jgi:predicted aconitase with swiveling domain
VALFHAVGITPEAPTREDAFGGREPEATHTIDPSDVGRALQELSTVPDGSPITAVCLGTPHFSRTEWDRLIPLLRQVAPWRGVPIYVSTDRTTMQALQAEGRLEGLDAFGLKVVTDTCTYLTPIVEKLDGAVMTNSGKWAHYAPGNLGFDVAFGELEDCIASAAAARVIRHSAWGSPTPLVARREGDRLRRGLAGAGVERERVEAERPARTNKKTKGALGYAPGSADAPALVLQDPLSLWGGIDVETGRIIDHSHPDRGACVSGTILVMPGGRGSSSSSSVLAEALRRGTGPAAIVLAVPDPILTVGALVARSLYGLRCPILVCDVAGLATGARVRVSADETGAGRVDVDVV